MIALIILLFAIGTLLGIAFFHGANLANKNMNKHYFDQDGKLYLSHYKASKYNKLEIHEVSSD